ncbi:type II secretion system protein [Marinobacterium stanieri]|uniref:Prepilin-type N-terminal cleavage/methylation domain-containing protein n=1 Tax=Marinobacterium stanieri TaxID=49186 RepID=A0A1N6XHC4_9GAMM|nr:type II secretion system protein [Marinobacterium stanieri]SIR01744.1 prepilin-type N-terminal cleavage/methylation domain-containing protein [Marinobacterium stanieri]
MNRQQGFTLLELVLSIFLLGVLTVVIAPSLSLLNTAQSQEYRSRTMLSLERAAGAMMEHVRLNSAQGRLPAPYTGDDFFNTLIDPTPDVGSESEQLMMLFRQAGLAANEINTDGYASQRIRKYQMLSSMIQEVPFAMQTGDLVELRYDFGVIYQTTCPLADTGCNTNARYGDASTPVLTTANYNTWEPAGDDFGAVFISTLPIQKARMAETYRRIQKIRSALANWNNASRLQAAANSTDNFYPDPFPTGANNLAGANEATNQGCRDGWYDLSETTNNVLPWLGLSRAEYGVTAWGAIVEYCRDYVPATSSTEPVFYAALRLHRAVSLGLDPAGSDPFNIVITL